LPISTVGAENARQIEETTALGLRCKRRSLGQTTSLRQVENQEKEEAVNEEQEFLAGLITYLSFVAANLVNDLAETFESREDYLPFEGLASALQHEIVEKGAEYLNARIGS
jgi:hypothetical protein